RGVALQGARRDEPGAAARDDDGPEHAQPDPDQAAAGLSGPGPGPNLGRRADGPQSRAPLPVHPEQCGADRRGGDRCLGAMPNRRRPPPPPKEGLLGFWTIQRATVTGIAAGLSALIVSALISGRPGALLHAYA